LPAGNNVTGLSLMRRDMAAKQLQMLREAIPEAIKIAVLQQDYDLHLDQMAEIARAAVGLGVSVTAVSVGGQDLPHLFDDMKKAGSMLILCSTSRAPT
jgi:hypothetical protein